MDVSRRLFDTAGMRALTLALCLLAFPFADAAFGGGPRFLARH